MAVIPFSPLKYPIITPLPVWQQSGSVGEMWYRNRQNCGGTNNFAVPISQDGANQYNQGYAIRFKASGLISDYVNVYAVEMPVGSGNSIQLTQTATALQYSYCNGEYDCQIVVDISEIPCGEYYFQITTLADERFYSEVFYVYQKDANNTFGLYTFSKNMYDGVVNEQFCEVGRFNYSNVFTNSPTSTHGLTNYYYNQFLEIVNGEQYTYESEVEDIENEDGTTTRKKAKLKHKYIIKTAPLPPFAIMSLATFEQINSCEVFVNDQQNSYGGDKLIATEIKVTSEPIDDIDCYYQATIEFVGDLIQEDACCDETCDGSLPCWSDDVPETSCIIETDTGYEWELFLGTPCSEQWNSLSIGVGDLVLDNGDYYMNIGSNDFANPNQFFYNIQATDAGGCTPVVSVVVPNQFPFVVVEISDDESNWYYYASGTPNQIRNGLTGTVNENVTGDTIYIRVKIGFQIPDDCTQIDEGDQVSETITLVCGECPSFDYQFDFEFCE